VTPASIAARVIPAIGRSDFADHLLSVYRDIAGCDLCSAMVWEPDRGPRLLFAAGTHPYIPGFALSAARAYVQSYWQLDDVAQHIMIHDCSGVSLVRKNADDIQDPDYRRFCYSRGGISERLMLFDADSPTVSVSGFRAVARGPMTPEVVQQMEDAAPTIVAALRRHNELLERQSQVVLAPSREVLLQRAREWGLSAREAEVAVGLATGQSQADIAKSTGLALNSVITYRRRAYQKLKVADRLELRAMYGQVTAAQEEP
jgi:DNA-binding NarL/FixJ family response regulator